MADPRVAHKPEWAMPLDHLVRGIMPLLVLLVSLAVTWGVMQARIDAMDARICELEILARKQEEQNTTLLIRLAEIQKDLSWLRMDMNNLIRAQQGAPEGRVDEDAQSPPLVHLPSSTQGPRGP